MKRAPFMLTTSEEFQLRLAVADAMGRLLGQDNLGPLSTLRTAWRKVENELVVKTESVASAEDQPLLPLVS